MRLDVGNRPVDRHAPCSIARRRLRVPSELGAEGVGRVVRVGAGVDQSLVGRRVLVLPTFFTPSVQAA
ncbi:MAG TPA: alcohol dehydrogenase catalytic domain-containing protein [Solirubrobacteraceae bacterium]|nr:alcohol dehydrogenase catalytic domain-containing protein [Solirubrobacteraceae bacterium]